MSKLSHQSLAELLSYDQRTGVFRWLKKPSRHVKVGDVAGSIVSKRYRNICIKKRHYLAHRLAWFYVNGEWPPQHIDHINGDAFDNRISNLRLATPSQNCANRKVSASSGLKGAYFRPRKGKWESSIMVNGRVNYLGQFDTAKAAHVAYLAKARELHGVFARGE